MNGPVDKKPRSGRSGSRRGKTANRAVFGQGRLLSGGSARKNRSITLPEAVEVVQSLKGENWQRTIAKQGMTALGDDLWAKFEAQWRIAGSLCGPLAKAAREILRVKAKIDQVDKVSTSAIEAQDASPIIGEIISALVAGTNFSPLTSTAMKLETIAHAIRILGIFLCTVFGDLRNCVCLKDLATGVTKQQFEKSLWSLLSTN